MRDDDGHDAPPPGHLPDGAADTRDAGPDGPEPAGVDSRSEPSSELSSEPPQPPPDFDLDEDELTALSAALDDAFEETFDPEPTGEQAAQLAAAQISASNQALDGTSQMLRDSRSVLRASLDAMRASGGGGRDTDAPAPSDPEPLAPDAPPSEVPEPDAPEPSDPPDALEDAPDDGLEPARARAELLSGRETETVDLEDADDDPHAGEAPSRPPDSLVGAIPWDDDGAPGPLRIAIAGGRGGAGRTLLVANAALVLARLGRRCAVVDLDPVGAGLHTALGLDPLLPGPSTLADPPPIAPEPVPGVPLHLLRPGRPALAGPADPLRAECYAAALERDDDALLLDLGAQADPFTLDAWLEADVSVVVAEPLPAAIERAYGFLRAALWRRLLHGGRADDPAEVARELIAERPDIDSPQALVEALADVDADAARAIRARVLTFTPRLLMNRTRTRIDREMGPAMVSALRRRWGVTADFLGAIDFDEAVREAARRRRPLLLAYPGAGYSQAIEKIARRLVALAEARSGLRGAR